MAPAVRPFRFGLHLRPATSADEWAKRAQQAEDLGYSVVTVSDHVGGLMAPLPALAAAAAATRSIRLGTIVLNNDLRHPAVLAQELATLDILSGGRLEIGLGAGWLQSEYERAGVTYDPASVRVQRLSESISILKGLFGPGPFTFDGRAYQVRDLDGQPKPVQLPHPPLLIGGGSRRILSLAAREASSVGVHVDLGQPGGMQQAGVYATSARIDEKLAWIHEAAGERSGELELHMTLFKVSTTTAEAVAPELEDRFGLRPEDVADSPHIALGSPAHIAETLVARRERFGISYFTVLEADRDTFAPVLPLLAGS